MSLPPKLRVLCSYPYYTARVGEEYARHQDEIELFLDCGAFTAWKLGRPIELDDYCRFIDGMAVKPWRYFTLDVVGNPAATMRNYEIMLKRGFSPMPIFTRGEDISVLDDFYKTSDLVGLGGLAGTGQDPRPYVKSIMRHTAGRWVHILGFTKLEWIKYFRPYSCDSSSWEAARRYGSASVYMGRGKFSRITRRDLATRPRDDIMRRIRALGISPADLLDKDAWIGGSSLSGKLTTRSWVQCQIEVGQKLGTRLFLAFAVGEGISLLYDAYSHVKKADVCKATAA